MRLRVKRTKHANGRMNRSCEGGKDDHDKNVEKEVETVRSMRFKQKMDRKDGDDHT